MLKYSLLLAALLCGSLLYAQDSDDTGKVNLPFPIYDYYDYTDQKNSQINLEDPSNIQTEIRYNPATGNYEIYQTIGGMYYRNPTSMTLEEYMEYQRRKAETDYFKEKIDSETEQQRGNLIPPLKIKDEKFDIVFGGDEINIRPQGSAELSFGVNISRYDNPVLPVRQRRVTTFDFNQKIQLNMVGQIGDKLKLTIAQNTEATFNFQNQVKIEYTGYEDEIIQKIEAGNVALPLNTTLIQGSQSLFGIRTDLKFGRLTVNTLLSQQKGKRQEINVSGGAQVQDYEVKADNYEANRHYFLNFYHREHYDTAMQTMPIVSSEVNITKIEVWVTNRINKVEDTRNVVAFSDLGETRPEYCEGNLMNFTSQLPDNGSNELYETVTATNDVREFSNSVAYLSTLVGAPGPFEQSIHYEKVENARRLTEQEFTYNGQLGFISLKSPLNQDEVLGVAYQFTYRGRTYQVGEFSNDVPVEEGSKSALILKMLKPTIVNPNSKLWDLMMKNIYSLGAYQVGQADFILDLWYNNPQTSVDINYLPYDGVNGVMLMQQLDLDRLNLNQELSADGRFDFVPITYEGNRATNGGTIDARTGRVYFTTIEPFGKTLREKLENESALAPTQIDQIVYFELYDSTKIAAQQIPAKNRFRIKGSYKSSVSSEISLNALNVPEGSVTVLAGGVKLTEGVDYTVDYNLGRVRILNQGILESGTPIKVQMENNSLFGFDQKSLVGAHFNYEFNKDFNWGATIMNLTEKPLTQKVNIGDEPVSNTVIGTDISYRTELPWLTKAVDFLPVLSTKAKSSINAYGEFAYLIPGTQRAISKEGISYIDGFEGSQSAIDIKNFGSWKLASTPQGQPTLFPEASDKVGLTPGYNRAHIAWYIIDPTTFFQNSSITPDHIRNDPDILTNSLMHPLTQTQLFPQFQQPVGTLNNLPILDLAYYPAERGPYNYDTDETNMNTDGTFTNPEDRWAGVMRSLTTTNFETANIQFIQFWMLDPFNDDATDSGAVNMGGGDLYFNLGNISEDILPDSRRSFENGLPPSLTFDPNDYDTTAWSAVSNQQVIVNAFDNNTTSRQYQDVGLDGLSNEAERLLFADFIAWVNASGLTDSAKADLINDPSSDSYNYYLDDDYDIAEYDIVRRYKYFNGTEGNSPTAEMADTMNAAGYPTQSTTVPDLEDLNQDNNLSETESYFQYHVEIDPGSMVVGQNFIVNSQEVDKDGDGPGDDFETWYQFKIPIEQFESNVNNIPDFRSIRFMRMFVTNFDHPVLLRFARLELIRGEWRRYLDDINEPGEGVTIDPNSTEFNIAAVNLEENGQKDPVGYVIPPGIVRELDQTSLNTRQLNEQSLSLEVCGLEDGDARATFKNVNFDIRSYRKLKMFVHAEARNDEFALQDDQLTVFIRLGTDFEENYYEFEMPLTLTAWGTQGTEANADLIWPEANNMEIVFDSLLNMKINRDKAGFATTQEYIINITDPNTGKVSRIKVRGNPNLQGMKVIMIGVRNPGKDTNHPWMYAEDGMSKCAEVWANELRLTDFDQRGGWATTGRVNVQMADFASVNLAGNYSTPFWGSIEKKVSERQRDTQMGFDGSTNMELGQFLGNRVNLQVPFYFGYSWAAIEPQFDLLSPDVELRKLDPAEREARAALSRDVTIRKAYNFTNVRRERPAGKKVHFWDIENWTATYSYNELYRRDINTKYDITKTYNGRLIYNYSNKPLLIQPFKNVGFLKKSNWFKLIRDFNFNLGPKSFSFNNDVSRMYNERQNRNALDTSFVFLPTYLKNFMWTRNYDLKYDFTKNFKFTFSAINNSIILEPEGIINSDVNAGPNAETNYSFFKQVVRAAFDPFYGRDSIRTNTDTIPSPFGGQNMRYNHDFNITYRVPFNGLPLTDWITANVKLRGSYEWQRAPIAQPLIGNQIQNNRNFTVNGQFDFVKLYNKVGYLRKINGNGRGGNQRGRVNSNKGTDGKGKDKDKDKDKDKGKKDKDKEINPIVKTSLRMLMALRNISFNYTENDGMVMPGFTGEPSLFGMDNFGAPGWQFASGFQNYDLFGRPSTQWTGIDGQQGFAPYAAGNGWLEKYPGLNIQHVVSHSQNINVSGTIEPFKDVTIRLTADRKFTNNLNTFYRWNDSLAHPLIMDSLGYWEGQNNVNSGSINFTTITWGTSFQKMDSLYVSDVFSQMLSYRQIVSEQIGIENGSTENPDGYYDGYGANQQDVLIGSFLAAYTGRGTDKGRFDVFKAIPLPNWDIRYDGLAKYKFMKKYVRNFSITHAYRSSVSVTNFSDNLAATDQNGVVQRDASGNIIAPLQIQNVTVSEQFAPFLGLNATWKIGKNGLITKVEYKRDRAVALNTSNFQITEMRGNEVVIGTGYKFTKVKMPFQFMGKTPESDLTFNFDLSIRQNIAVTRNIAENTNQPTSGQNMYSLKFRVDYNLGPNLNVAYYFDRTANTPVLSNAFPTANTATGIALRFNLAQ